MNVRPQVKARRTHKAKQGLKTVWRGRKKASAAERQTPEEEVQISEKHKRTVGLNGLGIAGGAETGK